MLLSEDRQPSKNADNKNRDLKKAHMLTAPRIIKVSDVSSQVRLLLPKFDRTHSAVRSQAAGVRVLVSDSDVTVLLIFRFFLLPPPGGGGGRG